MNKINDRFYKTLFVEKNVLCNRELYNKMYDSIWICEELFIEFLTTSDTSLRFERAKEIYDRLQLFDEIIIPSSNINKLLYFQTFDLVDNQETYIPQDHVIHSINLYVLGIYVFFNNKIFYEKILGRPYLGNTINDQIAVFIEKWKHFALYHDIGYYVEANIKKDVIKEDVYLKYLKDYENIFHEVLYNYVIRYTSRLIIWESLFNPQDNFFDFSLLDKIDFKNWTYLNNDICDSDDTNHFSELPKNMVLIDDIYDLSGAKNIIPLIENVKYLIILYDDYRSPILIILNNGALKSVYKNNLYVEKNIQTLQDAIFNLENCLCQIYIEKMNDVMDKVLDFEDIELAKTFRKSLPLYLQNKFYLITNNAQLEQLFYELCIWLKERIKFDEIGKVSNVEKKSRSKYYSQSIKNAIEKLVGQIEDEYTNKGKKPIEKTNLKSLLKNIIERFDKDKILDDLHEQIQANAIDEYKIHNGSAYTILSFCSNKYSSILKKLIKGKDEDLNAFLSNLLIFKKRRNNYYMDLFLQKTDKNSFAGKLQKELETLAENYNISFTDIINYKTPYTRCDHGLISAALMFQSIVFYNYLIENSDKNNKLMLGFQAGKEPLSFKSEHNIKECADLIFSVLLHNIYSKNSGVEYGLDYVQNIDINPFSYFCAFCDTIQKWHRPKQIDISKSYLSKNHFLEDDFDISTKDNKIIIKCGYDNINAFKDKLKNEESFLLCLSEFVEVHEI